MPAPRPARWRLVLFGSGDFACNLYWQSVTLYLLFFYTDVLGLTPGVAGLIAMIGAIWDGLADLAVGIVAQRGRYRYRTLIAGGAIPLGVAFALLYGAPAVTGTSVAAALVAHIAFRSLYALVNVPYAAWSTRITQDSGDRTFIAGARMLFGAAAATIVALGTPWIAARIGDGMSPSGYVAAAAVFAAVATPVLLMVAASTPEVLPAAAGKGVSVAACLRVLGRNRAFVTLNAAMAAGGIAAALLNQSVLYYFAHVVGDPGAGPGTLAMMGLVGVVVVPLWTWWATRRGARSAWFVAALIGLGCAAGFAMSAAGEGTTRIFLLGMQVAFAGFSLAGWAMLPDTVEYGEATQGVRVEAIAFGVSALVQKGALAAAAAVIGGVYDAVGYAGGAVQAPAAVAGIGWLMIVGPAVAITLSMAAMVANPLRRGTHDAIVAGLGRG
ncbi:hypothetical protein ASG67_00810 [Sphingomonas sp. Leaf339]|uniref:MFS transporter n=1 Tax=Sphingomonas sp. Leaf339 TaxID=1736343 RepID=UPI0006FCC626|nr:glycoside-pentoside-hexuronide (GPH):cation symporter [Sphingomonas sp. Leaf339]KQU62503.1 hypothetical protein ASG67_00810 [Sphingomonas sp. Leaf339]